MARFFIEILNSYNLIVKYKTKFNVISSLDDQTTNSFDVSMGSEITLSWRHRFQNVFRPHQDEKQALSNSSGLNNVVEKFRRISVDGRPNCRNKAPFSWRISVDGRPSCRNKAAFSWRISVHGRPTVEINLRFRDRLVWTVGLTVEIKLRFRDRLVWTVGVSVEIKRRFLDGLVCTVGQL